MASERKMGITRGSYTLQYSTDNSGNPGLYVYKREATVEDKYVNTWLHMDYEMQVGVKLDQLFFESTRALQSSEVQMLKIGPSRAQYYFCFNLSLLIESYLKYQYTLV